MYNRKKTKLCRKFGERLFPEVKVSDNKLACPPGVHGTQKRRKNLSEYGMQLKEKQKMKIVYGMKEKQFRNLYNKALLSSESTPIELLNLLEKRLDNIVYRSQMSLTREQARQLILHGHILVNGKKVTISSYSVKAGDIVEFKDIKSKLVLERKEYLKTIDVNGWLNLDKTSGKVTVQGTPNIEEISKQFNISLVVQFYSR